MNSKFVSLYIILLLYSPHRSAGSKTESDQNRVILVLINVIRIYKCLFEFRSEFKLFS